jgi:hypothetical protein
MAADECSHVCFGTENTWMSGSTPAFRHYMSVSGSRQDGIAYWAEVLEMRMKSGGIGQDGGRGSKSDCEICKRVVVVLEVEGCHDLSDLDWERLTRGCNEADTPLPLWENQQL